ncbi:MAG: hypothetical protein OEM59_14010 [Rhodospirillales bacterium]|nr:hypothetical protein [Rhodospirillales bacterium]
MLAKLFAKKVETEDERRREDREDVAGGTIEIGGATYPLVNWSYSGFLAKDYTGEHNSGDRVEVIVSVLLDDGPLQFSSRAILVRVDREGRKIVGAYVEMDTATRVELARHFGG